MSRVTAPSKHLARQIQSSARPAAGLLDHNAGATLMPKYAELLANRRGNEHTDSSRGMTTTHRPTPQPSIANRSKPLMQTFTSSSTRHTPSTNIDATVLPSFASLHTVSSSAGDPIVPILPDNYSVRVAQNEEPIVTEPEVKIVAADPDKVVAGTPLSQVQGVSMDGVDVKFAHEGQAPQGEEHQGGMLRDLWKGMVDEVFGQQGQVKKA